MKIIKIKLNQIWRAKKSPKRLEVIGKRTNNRWLTRTLTDKVGVYGDSHSMPEIILFKFFDLEAE